MLTAAQKVAIELADALMTRPGDIDGTLRQRLHTHFRREQIIELTLDVMKRNYQKIPVALGVDPEVVPGRLADLVFDEHGDWVRPS